MEIKKKIILAMSGGVDSSVSLTLLLGAGLEVEGVHFRIKEKDFQEDEKMVLEVAKKFRIKVRIVDKRKDFKDTVVNYFLEGYKKGITPNPCVFCNKNFKFKWLLEEMKKEKADFVATGHYAQIRKSRAGYELWQAEDKKKDQSYFLYTLGQKELSRIIFPLGRLRKIEVRKIAKELELPVSDRKESQDICFLSGMKVEDFLRKNIPNKKGKIIDEKGRIRGEHQGISFYTIGQRKGINLGGDGPYYVFAKDFKKNFLQVSNEKSKKFLEGEELRVARENWISGEPDFPIRALVKIRYQEEPISAIIGKEKKNLKIVFKKSKSAITPGQSAVFYGSRGRVLGGGIIK